MWYRNALRNNLPLRLSPLGVAALTGEHVCTLTATHSQKSVSVERLVRLLASILRIPIDCPMASSIPIFVRRGASRSRSVQVDEIP